MQIEQLLERCGLSENKQKALLALLQSSPSSAGVLARRTAIKRPTVYLALENLKRRGLVVARKVRGALEFSSIASEKISSYLAAETQSQYESRISAIELLAKLLPQTKAGSPHQISGYRISAFDSPSAIYAELENALLSGDFCAIFNPQEALTGRAKKIVLGFLQRTAKTKPHIRELVVPGVEAAWYRQNINNPNHLVRDLPRGVVLSSDIIMLQHGLIITHYQPGTENSINIEHQQLAKSLRLVFDLLWISAK